MSDTKLSSSQFTFMKFSYLSLVIINYIRFDPLLLFFNKISISCFMPITMCPNISGGKTDPGCCSAGWWHLPPDLGDHSNRGCHGNMLPHSCVDCHRDQNAQNHQDKLTGWTVEVVVGIVRASCTLKQQNVSDHCVTTCYVITITAQCCKHLLMIYFKYLY